MASLCLSSRPRQQRQLSFHVIGSCHEVGRLMEVGWRRKACQGEEDRTLSCVFGTARQSFPCTSVSSLALVWHLVPWHSSLVGVRTWIRYVKCVDRAGGHRRAGSDNLTRRPGGFVKTGAGAAISRPPLGSAPRLSRATTLAALTCCVFMCCVSDYAARSISAQGPNISIDFLPWPCQASADRSYQELADKG